MFTLIVLTACTGSTTGSMSSSTAVPSPSTPATPDTLASATSAVSAAPAASAAPDTVASSSTVPAVAWLGPCGRPGDAPPLYDHVIWIWMENKNRGAVFDSTATPFMHSLAESCGTASNYIDHGIHPSLPNYIAATSGGTHGVNDDGFPNEHPLRVDNIFRQVREAGKVSRSYQEAMPGNCSLQSTDRYSVKHNPAAYYIGGDDRSACERDDVNFDQFLSDLVNDLPAFSLITPDSCNNMHDCPIDTGDKWLEGVVTGITTSPTYREGRTAVFIAFDESEGRGTTPFIAVAPSIVPGTIADVELDHYSLLAFTENALGIATRLGRAADAHSLADAFGL